MAKPFRIIVIILIAFLCALWSPWTSWNISFARLLGIEPPPQIGGLQVTSLAGEMEVFIDGISQGKTTPENSPLIIPAIEPGERQIRLQRISSVDDAYWEFNKLIKFESGVDVVISYELGPSENFSEGHVIYTTKTPDKVDGLRLNLVTNVTDAVVKIDDIDVGLTPLVSQVITKDKQHTLLISKNGYEPQEFKLLPESQEDRDKVSGFNLNVIVDLFLQPIPIK